MANERTVMMRGVEVTEAELVAKLEEIRRQTETKHGDVQRGFSTVWVSLDRELVREALKRADLVRGVVVVDSSGGVNFNPMKTTAPKIGTIGDFLKKRT